ncbi:DNA-binding MarR family transcriptional regulator [Bradyrhizobium sp. CIR48]|uniref:MarR family winged helix-turn-helix transcriptional regulator n=1 Tax=unclassified Bradyrhizobium TaxID=2631580 RepID=UPI0008EAD87B|nr:MULTISPECIES: MarR family transcriptional regulator [unclassified Bradyrhizobium]MBB4383188.1 DNA-binding MarR family transcriptional regulator [Bradyrhizobium sp. SBR1B]MBB4425272.1 DNA-binding MarR family transcriptional regulator [Bradyrhizobium sp. CIR48]SFN26129.1 DNA-binding transcriptional regulator, MarR family [Bradyrhizobium sp. Rc3b]
MYRFSNSLPYLLARLGVRMGDLFARVIRHEKLTLPMYRVLAALSEQGHPLRLGEIAELTSADVSTLSRIVAEMSRAGLLTRDRPENDQRSLQVVLTPKGTELAGRLMPLAAYYEEVVTGSMSAKEAAELKRVLVELYKNIDRLEQEVEAGSIKVPPPARPKEIRDERPEAKARTSQPRGRTSRK